MPSPPLSPTPRRWRSSPDQPHPDFAALLSSFEQPTPSSPNSPKPKSENESLPEWATPRGILSEEEDQKDEDEVEFLTATASTSGPNPEIRTTSPSPQRPAATSRAAELGLDSPLLPPNRGRLFGEDYSKTVNQLGSRGIFANELVEASAQMADSMNIRKSARLNAPAEFPFPITTQTTGQSTATIDAAYDGVLSQLDALANPSTSRLPPASGSSSNPYLPPSNFQPMPIRQPLVGLGINMNSSSSLSQPTSPGLGNFTLSRLSTVTERTEKSSSPTSERSNTHSHTLSPTFPGAYKEGPSKTHSASASTIAGKYPLPPSPSKVPSSPIKGPRSAFSTAPTGTVGTSASGTPQGTPQKASDLIKMFESKGDSPNVPPQPKFLPSSPTKPIASKPTSTSTSTKVSGLPSSGNTHPDTTFNTPSAPPSSYRTPLTSTFEIDAPTPPPKSPSPLSQVRGMIASWRARSGSPSQRVVGPVSGGPGLFRSGTGDKGWNVSIRRRRRNEKELAEQADEATEEEKKAPSQHSEEDKKSEKSSIHDEKAGEEPRSRSGSLRSDKKSSEPKQLTGDPIRTGALYFLNVHDEDDKPNFKWVRADGRLYPEGLELTWISGKGKATVTLDLEFCDEVASTYSPNNPMAGDDIGAAAARRQGQLADSLYPFKLVYDDGVERLACDSARDRVRWVNAIWTVLKRTRAAPSASLRANRSSSDHGSEAGGSASTHFTPAEVIQPLPSSPLPSSTGSHPLYTTDDAVIETSGGFHAPIVQRDSRKLAAGGLERIRSLRRVASEADLKEVSAPPLPGKDVPLSPRTTGMLDVPLTAQNAERPRSRDFTFAHGIKPPTLKSEGSPSEIFQTPATVRGMSTPSSHTAMQGESASPPMGTAPPFSSDSDRTAVMPPATSTAMGTAQPFSVTSDWTARHPSTASTPMGTANQFSGTFSGNTAPTPAGTAQPWTSSASVHTPRGPSPSAAIPFTPTGVPQVAVTGASPSGPSSETAHSPYGYHGTPSLSAASERNGSSSTGSTSQRNPALMVPGSPGSPSNTPVPSDRASSRMSRNSGASTYQTAPPPVPSRDSHYSSTSPSKASSKASSPIPSPTRYSLHDAPVPSFAESVKTPSAYPTATQGDSYFTAQHPTAPTDYGTAQLGDDLSSYHERPPTTRYATATTDLRTGSAGTAPTSPSRSPRSSEYDTAPPPPIFRTASSEAGQSSTDRLTDGLTSRRGSRAWTQVSHPDSDDELLVDLERRSSNSSSVSRRTKSKYAITNYSTVQTPSRTMHTAQTFDRSARTPLGTARENTMYTGARDSAYTTATGWQTLPSNYATAPPAQSWYTARTSQTAPTIRGEVPPPLPSTHPAETVVEQQSVSTASTIPSRRIPRPTAAPSPAQPAPEVRYLPPPSPSFPSSVPGSSDSSTTAVSSTEATTRDVATGTDVNRLLNYLQGQDQARQGQTTRVGNQLDRIERRVNQIAENQSALAERDGPPPVPAKDDDESPPPSPSSATSSTSTARPVTPPPLIIPEVINQQFDDLRNLLGTLIGRQEDLLGRQDEMAQEMNRRRSYDVELPDRGPGMARLEDLLKRVLQRVGDSEFADDFEPSPKKKGLYPIPPMATPKSEGTRDGSMYEGGDSIYGSEFGARGRGAPANSIASSFDRRRRRPISEISSSLIDGEIPEPEFDEEFALSGLPPDTPPEEFISRQPQFPRHLVGQQRPRAAPTPQQQYIPPQPVPPPEPIQEYPEEEEYYDERPEQEPSPQPEPVYEPSPEPAYQPQPIPEQPATEYEPTPPPVQQREMTPDQPPIPFRSHDDYQDDNGQYQDDALQRGPYQPGPPPQPVDLPTPVNSPRNMPPYSGQQTGMRPGFAPAGMPAPPIPGPAMTDMPRPSLPRIAGVRDPISTTYYRRGFPPGPMGPMGPMGMFPGPMGIPGPGMGPFMPGLRPGMPGFGGPIGPNVNPSLRRNGFFPPGVNSTTGDYGLPAAARYGNSGLPPSGPTVMGQPRPPTGSGNTTTADTGLGNTTTESTVTTPSVTSMATEEILTPIAPTTGLQEPLHMPTGPMATAELPPIPLSASHIGTVSCFIDDSFRRALGNNQALAAAQGEQQNEMSRYLHGMSDQIADGTLATQNQLAEILGDIAVLREQLKPKHVHARVLPDGTVMLDNGDIVDGIRGAPAPVPPGAPPPPPPPASASHVEGHILPDGTVMVGGKVVDGIKGAPSVAEPGTPMMELNERIEETVKNQQQDAKLAELQDKIEELMAKTAVPPPVSAPPPAERIYEEEEIISARADSGTDANGLTPGLIPTTIGDATPLPTPAPAMTSAGPNTDIRREKQVIKEREVIREGPVGGRHKEVTVVDEIEKDMVTTVPPGSLPAGSMPPGSVPLVTATLPPGSAAPPGSVVPPGTVLAEEENVAVTAVPTAPGSGGAAASGTSHTPPPTVSLPIAVPTAVPTAAPPGTAPPPLTRLNPRTGKPLTIPPALSAHSISPIQTDYDPNPPAPSHLIREEHEEIIQHPASGGPPIHTHTTTRTYTQAPAGTAPAGSVPPATIMGDQPVTAVPPTVGPSASVHPSAGKAATVAPPAVSVVPSASGAPDMPVIASGAHTSDHQATVQQAPPNIATVKSAHESETVAPGPVPIDSKNASTSHTVHPGVTVADPSVVVPPPPASVAPAPPPQTASNVPSGASKPAWDGNHAKSPKPSKAASLANVPSEKPASVANVPSGPPSGAPPPPASAANVPATPAPPSVAPDAPAGKLPPASAADAPAAPPPASSGKGSGVHWDPMIPAKEVATTPPKSPKSPKSKPASIVEPPQATAANIPSGPPAAEIHNVPSAPEPTVPTEHVPTGHEVPIVRPGSADTKVQETHKSPSSLGGILKKPKSKESLKETTTTPAAHVSHLPTLEELAMEGRDLTVHPPGDTVHVPSHPAASSGSNKLRKKPPTFAEGSTADPANMANIPVPPSRAGTPAGSMKGATPVPMTMEEVVLPDGRTAYIPSRPASQAAAPLPADTGIPPPLADRPSTGKKGKSTASDEKDKEKVTSSSPPQKDTTHTGIPAESEVGRGHCSVCCPNGPRAVAGVPIEPCEHQGGILGQAAKQHSAPTGPRTNKSASQKLSKTPPNQPGSLGLPEAENVGGPGQEVDMGDVVGPPPTGPKPSSKGGKSQKSNPEEAMEDARKLAAKQKAAAEQAALEAAERDARLKDKEAKAKIAEERHRQNVEALANLQKALDLIAADGKATKTVNDEKAKAQEKRRTDKTARDKKITEALDKIVADREEEKKKAAANDKKPGTQAILDALKNKGDAESAFLRKLSTEIMEQNSNQHTLTQQAVKAAAREQVGFNLAGYLDDFSKALSGEVRVLLKEVGDLRESRRAFDLMAVLPYPAAPPKNPANQPKPAEKKDGGGGNQQQGQGKGKAPAGVPAWATWHPMMPPVMGRPLPQPGGPPPMSMNMSAGMVPPPPMGGKPLPQV
uniref:PH domain-containing protein n=1 Tax=Kwoniella dejecticola CBS 10117 TaxID=1296121 RepID=A0A1A5ZVI0_9TREE|nr:uncharacterized protein I303_07724 [Kwoniella dejecticola CBS 10117]OBR81814.1 hypothetical protein I303_07724 [Kwoniella dejecticola CBS 10117]